MCTTTCGPYSTADQTHNPGHPKQALYQLSYYPLPPFYPLFRDRIPGTHDLPASPSQVWNYEHVLHSQPGKHNGRYSEPYEKLDVLSTVLALRRLRHEGWEFSSGLHSETLSSLHHLPREQTECGGAFQPLGNRAKRSINCKGNLRQIWAT